MKTPHRLGMEAEQTYHMNQSKKKIVKGQKVFLAIPFRHIYYRIKETVVTSVGSKNFKTELSGNHKFFIDTLKENTNRGGRALKVFLSQEQIDQSNKEYVSRRARLEKILYNDNLQDNPATPDRMDV